jgi:hypothetical protein
MPTRIEMTTDVTKFISILKIEIINKVAATPHIDERSNENMFFKLLVPIANNKIIMNTRKILNKKLSIKVLGTLCEKSA